MLKYFLLFTLMTTPTLANPPYISKVAKSTTVVERKIQVFDTTIVTPHNQYYTAYPQDNIVQTVKIERVITPKQFIVNRIEVPEYNAIYQTVVTSDKVISKTIEFQKVRVCEFRNYCSHR